MAPSQVEDVDSWTVGFSTCTRRVLGAEDSALDLCFAGAPGQSHTVAADSPHAAGYPCWVGARQGAEARRLWPPVTKEPALCLGRGSRASLGTEPLGRCWGVMVSGCCCICLSGASRTLPAPFWYSDPGAPGSQTSLCLSRAGSQPPGALQEEVPQLLQKGLSSNHVTWRPWRGRYC